MVFIASGCKKKGGGDLGFFPKLQQKNFATKSSQAIVSCIIFSLACFVFHYFGCLPNILKWVCMLVSSFHIEFRLHALGFVLADEIHHVFK